jgi:hypothetical protein
MNIIPIARLLLQRCAGTTNQLVVKSFSNRFFSASSSSTSEDVSSDAKVSLNEELFLEDEPSRSEMLVEYIEKRKLQFPDDFQRKKVDGKWLRPRLSAMQKAKLRKAFYLAKIEDGEDVAPKWLESYDRPKMSMLMKPLSGRKHDKNLAERVAKIKANITPEAQAKKRAEYAKTLPPKAIKEGLLQFVKKATWEKD